MQDGRMRRHRQAFHPEWAFDFLVPEMPEVIYFLTQISRTTAALAFDGPLAVVTLFARRKSRTVFADTKAD